MIILYGKTTCPYTAKTIGALDALGLPFELKDVRDRAIFDELEKRGGKTQIPYLVDENVEMYDSGDIIAYLEQKYGGTRETEKDDTNRNDPTLCAM